jgi:hypothetical protein
MSEPNASKVRAPLVRKYSWTNPKLRIEADPLQVFKIGNLGRSAEFLGCGVGTLTFDAPVSEKSVPYQARYQVWVIRYPALSFPLTLLSAYLILWMPRKARATSPAQT